MSYSKAIEDLKIPTDNLSDESQNAIYIAREYAKESMNESIMPAHILKAILHKDVGLISFIDQIDKDYYYLLEWADIQVSFYPKTTKKTDDVYFDDSAHATLREAASYKIRFDHDKITPVCLLASLTTPGVGFSYEQLKTMPLTTQEIIDGAGTAAVSPTAGKSGGAGAGGAAGSGVSRSTGSKAMQKYCLNKNAMAAAGEIDPVIGFESEIAVIFEVLGRKTKSNLLITGESGVGKTALINGFVQRIHSSEAPDFLAEATVYELDLGAMAADSNYKSETEDRFKNIIDELQGNDNAILVIEAVDKLMDKHGSLSGASNILKQALNKGNIRLLCTASIDGYTKNIETDKEFVRKFEKITIEEPNADHCFRILKGAAGLYEKYHELTISDAVLKDAIRLAKRYLNDKSLPDSGFDLIDRTMSMIRTMNSISQKDIQSLQEKLTQLRSAPSIEGSGATIPNPSIEGSGAATNSNPSTGGAGEASGEVPTLDWLHYEIFNKVSCLLVAQLEDDVDFSKIETVTEKFDYLQGVLNKLTELAAEKRTEVDSSDLYAVIAKQTGIPLGKIQSKERDKLVNAEAILKKRVVGQDHAIKIILDAVFESRSGLNKKGQPMGSFFFLGPTGTGKTELAKALAEFLFQDESAMIRFDMSEFKEEHSVALLYGAPPGYVGYEEGGLLVNQIRQKPYSVVLFDEIEKAHRSVFDLFLQILDEGKLHDRLGRTGYFANALVLFTSNIGSQFIVESFGKDIIPKNNDLMDIMQGHFRPEFLGRLTEIVPFSPITEKIVTMIFEIHLKSLLKALEEQNITLQIEDEAKHFIAMSGFNAQFGARPIIGTIRKELRRPLSKMIISGQIKGGDEVVLTLKDEELTFRV